MEKTTGTRTGRKPKNDPADHKYSFRLNAEENTRFEKLLADSGRPCLEEQFRGETGDGIAL